MKRILVCLLCLLLAVSAAACGGASFGESSGGISPPPAASAPRGETNKKARRSEPLEKIDLFGVKLKVPPNKSTSRRSKP